MPVISRACRFVIRLSDFKNSIIATFGAANFYGRHNLGNFRHSFMEETVTRPFDSHLLSKVISFRVVFLGFIPTDFDSAFSWNHSARGRMKQEGTDDSWLPSPEVQ